MIKSFFKGSTFLILVANFQGVFFGLISALIISNIYPVEVQGVYYLVTSIVSWIILLDFGISHSLLYINIADAGNKILKGVGFYISVYFVVGVVFLLVAIEINDMDLIAFLYGFIFLLNSLLSILLHFFRAGGKELIYWRCRVFEFGVYNTLLVSFLLYGVSIRALLLSSIASFLINISFIIKYRIYKNIGFDYSSWRGLIFPVQAKVAIEYASAFIGLKPLLPIVAPFVSVGFVGKFGLSFALISVFVSLVTTMHLSVVNKLKKNNLNVYKLIHAFYISGVSFILLYICLVAFCFVVIFVCNLNIRMRLVSPFELFFLATHGAVIIVLNVYSALSRFNKKDHGWKVITIYNVFVCFCMFLSLVMYKDIFFGLKLSVGFSVLIIVIKFFISGRHLMGYPDLIKKFNLKN